MPEVISKAPAVQGALRDRPLPRLLQQLYRKRFTGYFVVTDQTGDESQVFVRTGFPVHVCRPVDTDRLDNLLVEYALIPPEIVAQASAQVGDKLRLGDVLERMGAIDRQKLAQVLKAQVMRKLTRLYFVAEGSYAVYVQEHGFGVGEEFALMRVDPRTVGYLAIRAAYDLPRVTRELQRLAGQRFRLADVSPSFVAALGIPADDATVESLRAAWMTLDDIDGVTARPFDVRSTVLALYYAESLERENAPRATVDSLLSFDGQAGSPSSGYRMVKPAGDTAFSFEMDGGSSVEMAAPTDLDTPEPLPIVPPTPAAASLGATAAPSSLPPRKSTPPSPPAGRPPDRGPAPSNGAPAATVPVVAPMAPSPRSAPLANGATASGGGPTRPPVSPMRPPAKPAPTAPTRPGGLTPEALRASILEMAAKLDKSTHFEILGVGQHANGDEVSAAFVRAARLYHPDRLSGVGLSDLQPQAERILARINEAVMVLQNPGRRAEYLSSLAVSAAQPGPNLPTLLEAENIFLRGEVFLKKGDHAKAIEAFTLASKGNPEEPQYKAYLAWARFEDPRARKEVLVRDTLKVVEAVLRERPRFARGHYWAGQLWKFLNEGSRAEHYFREAVQLDPAFIEASRELRLIEMRKSRPAAKGKEPEPPRGGGFMGKFWKK